MDEVLKERDFPGGVWPVMLTPYTPEGGVDYPALERLTHWYMERGADGLFAVAQTSEMFFLTLEERLQVARTVVRAASGRVPVIASGHISDSEDDQAREINDMAQTGVDAVILITNRLAAQDEGDDLWLARLEKLLGRIDPAIPLGFYECPYPYKRLMTPDTLRKVLSYDRFYFLKDTCCDLAELKAKQAAVEGSRLGIYNANTATLLNSLRAGIKGYSGIMVNFHPELYAWLMAHQDSPKAGTLQEFLTMTAFIEKQLYPVNAKYSLGLQGIPMETLSRTCDNSLFTETMRDEVRQMLSLSGTVGRWLRE